MAFDQKSHHLPIGNAIIYSIIEVAKLEHLYIKGKWNDSFRGFLAMSTTSQHLLQHNYDDPDDDCKGPDEILSQIRAFAAGKMFF